MLNIKPWLADFLGALTPQLITAGYFQPGENLSVHPALTPDHAPNACVTNAGLAGEIMHGVNLSCSLKRFQHVLDIARDLDSASKHGIMDFDLAKSRPLTTPREIAGASGMGASGHAHQSKVVR